MRSVRPQQYYSQSSLTTFNYVKRYQSKKFSYRDLVTQAAPGLSAGMTTFLIKAGLTLMFGSSVLPPLAATLFIVTGALLLGYGAYQGLKYANTDVIPDDCEEDIEPVVSAPKGWWAKIC